MSTSLDKNGDDRSAKLPEWADCDFFCIHDYAGGSAAPCGWRGRLHEARPDVAAVKLLCPRCGCATLLRIPSGTPEA